MNLTSPAQIKSLLKQHNMTLKKSLGQNFLIDSQTVEKIADAAKLRGDELVIEIGPGIGTLTQELAKRAKKVLAVELDEKLLPILEETLADYENVEIVHADFLKLDLEELVSEALEQNMPIKVSANLPYYITTPILMKFLESDVPIEHLSFLVQKEVAERIASSPGSKTYGALSVISQYFANTNIPFEVPAEVFMPKPKVDSALIELEPIEETLETKEREHYFKVVKAAFANRRKTLVNSLSTNLGLDKKKVKAILQEIGIDPRARAETLSDEDFKQLAFAL